VPASTVSPSGSDRPPATLTQWLRERDDAALAALLRRRPDLALPAPADLPTLASRLSVRSSVQRALDGLDALRLRVLEALLVAAGPGGAVSRADAAALLAPVDAAVLDAALRDLAELALAWGTDDRWHLVAGVSEALQPHPAGLGRPAATLFATVPDVSLAMVQRALELPVAGQPRGGELVAGVLADRTRLAALVAACDPDERAVLDRLAGGPPIGVVRDAHLPVVADSPVPALRLLARGLLVRVDARTVELPREVGLALRERGVGPLEPVPPAIAVTERPPAELDRAGGTAVLEVLRLVAALGGSWAAHPAAQLRAGGLGVRDLRRTAQELNVAEPVAALLIETAAVAGLVNASLDVPPVYLPTPEFDTWLQAPPAARWAQLTAAWLTMARQPSRAGQRDDQGRTVSVLGPGAERGILPALRHQVLELLAALPPGSSPQSRQAVLARLRWQAPRRAASRLPLAEAVLAEADLLGLTVGGGLTGYTRTLLDGSRAVAEQVLADALPTAVDAFLVQPDLTLIVPGPPVPELADELALLAELESSGGASVYRITEPTVRRALDAGRSAGELHAFLQRFSRTPIPQALSYLIDDAARRHGALRTGAASAYLRSDDQALLDRVVSDRAVQGLDLRRLAPTVAVSSVPVARLLDALRAAGYAPAAEAPNGEVIALGVEAVRAPSRPAERPSRRRPAVDDQQLAELVRRIRTGDALSSISTRTEPAGQSVPAVTSAVTMGVLREAIRQGRQVLLDCVEADGTSARHAIWPISMAAGMVRGHEPDRGRLASFPLHRLTRVLVLDDDEPGAP
jgi:hypothetical protein